MPVPDPASSRHDQIPRGILYMVASTIVFAAVNSIVKLELARYPVGEVAWFRALFAFATVAILVVPRSGLAVLRTTRYRQHLQRGISQFGSMMCMFLAFSLLPLGSAVALGFAAPLFTALLSIVVLKEKVGVHRWSALIAGFVGVVIVTHPGAGSLQFGAIFALSSSVLISSVTIAIRRMSATESAATLTLYQMMVITLCTSLLLPFGYAAPTLLDASAFAVAGIGNGVAQYWWTRSLALAPPSAIAPFSYLSLLWATALGFAIWGDVPTADMMVGSAVMVASGLYILWRETLRRRVPVLSPQPERGTG
jgi:drug/metabolite transporter (DMT)-like permease